MSTPAAPGIALNLTANKDAFHPGEELAVTVATLQPVTNTITVSATDPASGVTVNGTLDVTVHVPGAPAGGLQLGISDSLGDQFTQEAGDNGAVVFKTTIAPPPAPAQ